MRWKKVKLLHNHTWLSPARLLLPASVRMCSGVRGVHPFKPVSSQQQQSRFKIRELPYTSNSSTPPNSKVSAARQPKVGQIQPASFPLDGGALKCCGCGRWHNVPDKVMHEVRCSLEVL